MTESRPAGPLKGLRIVDISTVVAGPFAAGLLGDYGAEIVKVEMPGVGDSLRALAPHKDGVPLWWKVTNRNKKGVTLDLRLPEGRDLFARLVADADVLVENFRPGTLDGWGITRAWLQGLNPRLTILRVTGFGQDGPYAGRPGFARIFEAMSGFTQICGEEDGRPLHLGYPISDAVAGLFGALGILAALHDLARNPERRGQEIDCSATEAMMRTLEFLAIEYDQLGAVRTRSGNRSQYAAPGNVYRTADDKWASIAASTQSIFVRLCAALDLKHLLEDPRFALNPARVKTLSRARRDRRRRHRQTDPGGTARDLHPPRGRLLADLRYRRRLRRSAVRGAPGDRKRARRGAGFGAHAGRSAALLRDTGRRAPRRPGDGTTQ